MIIYCVLASCHSRGSGNPVFFSHLILGSSPRMTATKKYSPPQTTSALFLQFFLSSHLLVFRLRPLPSTQGGTTVRDTLVIPWRQLTAVTFPSRSLAGQVWSPDRAFHGKLPQLWPPV